MAFVTADVLVAVLLLRHARHRRPANEAAVVTVAGMLLLSGVVLVVLAVLPGVAGRGRPGPVRVPAVPSSPSPEPASSAV